MTPQRIQLSRARGYRMPAGAVKVDRTTKWGNPHKLPAVGNATRAQRQRVVDAFRRDLLAGALAITVDDVRRELGGAPFLGCWCSLDRPCHVDVYIEVLASGAAT